MAIIRVEYLSRNKSDFFHSAKIKYHLMANHNLCIFDQ